MFAYLRDRLTERKSLLIGCACCRLHWSEITLAEYHTAVAVLERKADGNVSEEEFAEEVRLLYVGMTRATHELHLSASGPSPFSDSVEAAIQRL